MGVYWFTGFSDVKQVLCGVPQGSILGPKVFILYINDICNISSVLNLILYPDDTNIFVQVKIWKIVCVELFLLN